jgi:hypothetical protein
MQTPLRMREILRFVWASLCQIGSAQGPAYVRFLTRVIRQRPDLLWDACALAAKGYHLRKMTEQVIAVDHFKRTLMRTVDQLREDIARRAHDGTTQVSAYVREVKAHVQKEYDAIHHDFRHEVDESCQAFLRALETALHECQLPLPRPS